VRWISTPEHHGAAPDPWLDDPSSHDAKNHVGRELGAPRWAGPPSTGAGRAGDEQLVIIG
jgi:hypothetical protein